MNTMDIIFFGVIAVILIVLGIRYSKKKEGAEKSIQEAEQAMENGDDSVALLSLMTALIDANETPDLELEILDKIENLYRKNQIAFDLANYRRLVENSRVLLRKTSQKSQTEFSEIDNLKQKIRDSFPPIKKGDVVDISRGIFKDGIDKFMKK